jgi:hypothetical protein
MKNRGSGPAGAPFAGAGEFTRPRGSGSFSETNRPAQQIKSENLILKIEAKNFAEFSIDDIVSSGGAAVRVEFNRSRLLNQGEPWQHSTR